MSSFITNILPIILRYKFYIITFFIALILGWYLTGNYYKTKLAELTKPLKDSVYVSDNVQVDTNKILEHFQSQLKPKFIYINKPDTTGNFNWCMEWIEKHNQNNQYQFIAKKDTLYKNDLLTASVSFFSRIPLDPLGIFKVDYQLNIPEIEKRYTHIEYREHQVPVNIAMPLQFWDRFGIGAYAGFGIGILSKRFEPQIGIGGFFKL